jgi:hypothetical protein
LLASSSLESNLIACLKMEMNIVTCIWNHVSESVLFVPNLCCLLFFKYMLLVKKFLFLFKFLLLILYMCSGIKKSKKLAVCIFRVPTAIRTITLICDKIIFCFKSSTDCYNNINIYKRCFHWMVILDETDYISCAMHTQKIDAICAKEMPLQFINILSIILCRFTCSQINSHSLIWNKWDEMLECVFNTQGPDMV